jgi:hypothetical protein
MKQITGVYTALAALGRRRFPVRSMFSYQTHGEQLPLPAAGLCGPHLPGGTRNAASVSIRIADLKPSPSSIPVK